MAYLPPTGFPSTAYPSLPPYQRDQIRRFDPHTLPIGRPGEINFGGLSAVEPLTVSHQ